MRLLWLEKVTENIQYISFYKLGSHKREYNLFLNVNAFSLPISPFVKIHLKKTWIRFTCAFRFKKFDFPKIDCFWRRGCLYFCLVFLSHSRIFHLIGDVANTGEGLQILTCTRQLHVWLLRSWGSLTYIIPSVTRVIVYIVNLRGHMTLTHIAKCLSVELSFNSRSVATGIRAPNLPHVRRGLSQIAPPPRQWWKCRNLTTKTTMMTKGASLVHMS